MTDVVLGNDAGVAAVRAAIETTRPTVLRLRDACASNMTTFGNVHVHALRIAGVLDVTPVTNAAVHVSVVGRDLSNFQLIVLDYWDDPELTPTLIAHFYLSVFEFMKGWPQILFERNTKKCLRQIRADGFADVIRILNSEYQKLRDVWWEKLHRVRNNYAGHYDQESSNLIQILTEIDLVGFFDLAKHVNELLLMTAQVLTEVSDEMFVLLKRIAATK